MSNFRQQASQVRSYSITHPPGRVSLPTQPGWDYLVFAHSGLFTAMTDDQAWTIPANRALCVPDGTRVRIETTRRAAIRCLYLDESLAALGDELRVVNLTPLTRELMSHAVATAPMSLETPANEATIVLLAERLANEPGAPLHLALPADEAAKEVASSMMCNPALDLADHLRAANANRRTVERRFKSETRMSLGQWRRRARILAAVTMLSRGDSVTRVAVTVGYASPSSFVSAFRSELGSPPREFMQAR
ncbi:MAG: AraC family transcriptional regulator [Acidimicrobiales bacterium]